MAERPIEAQKAVELIECGVQCVSEARVVSSDTSALEWDRFMRLSRTAEAVRALKLSEGTIVLDVGGFDGAFALFVPDLRVWVVDPVTTGGSGLALPFLDGHFDVVVSIDALEHVPRGQREQLLHELVRVCRKNLFINFPEARSMPAQKQVLSLVQNRFIQEHVEYNLPRREETIATLKGLCPKIKINAIGHTSIAVWVPWYVLFHTMKGRGLSVSAFLKIRENEVNSGPFLYDLLECDVRGDAR
ncbi:MAG TPA: class I SAM-dependent methyltransferase [Candidatus Nanoarchaeia archaeon]|nr:class I SAM-dependent methyltransferase [Candidatus Nanoarchaeia archaeon]